MKIISAILLIFLTAPWLSSEAKEVRGKYLAKADKRHKKVYKRKRTRFRYIGARDVNRAVVGDFLKLRQMVRDLNE